AVGFLAVATRARRPEFPRWGIYVPIIGGVAYSIGLILTYVGHIQLFGELVKHPPTVAAARSPSNGLTSFAQYMLWVGSFVLAIGVSFTSHHARLCGLVTKVFGYFGIAAGVLIILTTFPFVQIAWMAGLTALLLGL